MAVDAIQEHLDRLRQVVDLLRFQTGVDCWCASRPIARPVDPDADYDYDVDERGKPIVEFDSKHDERCMRVKELLNVDLRFRSEPAEVKESEL